MKIKKTTSDKVILANRRNAQKSTGPKDTSHSKLNALKHGLLARCIVFRDESERTAYDELRASLDQDIRATMSIILREEVARCWWNLQRAERELGDIEGRQLASRRLLDRFGSNLGDDRVSILTAESDESTAAEPGGQVGWDCREVLLRSSATSGDPLMAGTGYDHANDTSLVEVKLVNSMESVMRYQASLKRDLYRALQILLTLEGELPGE